MHGYRLSPLQSAIFLSGRNPGEFVCDVLCRIEGPLDPVALRDAIAYVINRNPSLRTIYVRTPGVRLPLQVVQDYLAADWQEANAASGDLLNSWLQAPIDVERGPIVRALLIRRTAEEADLRLRIAACGCDAAGAAVLLRELAGAYEGAALPEAALPYVNFAEWQNELLAEADANATTHWNEFRNAVERLTPDIPMETGSGGVGARGLLTCWFDANLFNSLTARAKSFGLCAEDAIFTCWAALLSRLSRSMEIAIERLDSNREQEDLASIVGLVAKWTPVCVPLHRDKSFVALVRCVRDLRSANEEFQDYCSPDPKLGSGRIGFEFREEPGAFSTGVVRLIARRIAATFDAFKLRLCCVACQGGLRIELHSVGGALGDGDVRRLAERFLAILRAAALSETWETLFVFDTEIVGDAERGLLLEMAAGVEAPVHNSVLELVSGQVKTNPGGPAVVCRGRTDSFAGVELRSNRILSRLRAMGVGPQQIVAITPMREQLVPALLGIWKAGAAYLPIQNHQAIRTASILAGAGVRVVVVDAATSLEQMPAGVEVLRVDEEEQEAAARGEENVPVGIDPEWAAYVMYTSGSTGEPKGVVVSHRALANYVQWAMEYYAVGSGERGAAVFTPLSFDLTVTSLWVPLAAGKSIRMGAGGEGVEELVEVAGEGVRDGLWKVTPAHLVALGECQGRVAAGPGALVAGGEALSGEHLEWWFEQAPESRVYNEYGPTETTVGCSVYRAQRGHKGAIPIGRPIANTQIYVLDEGMRLTPVGVAGELYIGGAGVARGYLERPEATAARFVPNPFGRAGSRLYRSGDGGRWNGQGELEYLGRGDQQVKLRGYRIELGEIEAVLRQGPGVRDCAVVVREGGAGQKMLVAYVAARGERGISWEELRGWMAERLPDYMTPQSMVQMERLPLTANGKIDREHLPAAGQEREERSYSGPESAAERLLAGIWEKLLGVERIGVEDNFFELGGDSILSIQAVARAREGGLRLTPKQMFEQQTIRGLGKVGRWEKGQEEEKRGAAAGEVAATPIQKWFWEEQGESGGREHFNQAVLLEGAGVRREALRAAVAGVLRQHDAVRLRWRRREGEWEQSYGTGEAGGLEVVDLSGVEKEERSKAIEGVCEAAQGGLRVEEGPLLRAVWMELGEGAGGRLLVVGHHLIVDGVSWRILLEDLQKGYGQAERGEGIELGRGSSTYQEWSRRLWEWGGGARVQGELAYWEGELGGGGGLKWGEGEGGGLAGEAREVRRGLGVERTRQLLQERGGAGGGQAQELLLAGLGRGLEPWMRGSGVVVEVEGHGREALGEGEAEELDVTRTVGWFTSLYPVVVEGWRGRGAGEVLEEMKERWRRVPGKGLGYGLLRYGGGEGEARLKRAGKAEISFNYLGQFDQALERGGQWKGAREGSGRAQSAEARRTHQLDIVAAVVGGRLQVSWYYAPRHMGEGEAEALADRYMEGVELLIAHCQAGGAAAYTPADFPNYGWSQSEFNRIVAAVQGRSTS